MKCHLITTIPSSIIYGTYSPQNIQHIFGPYLTIPMISTHHKDNSPYPEGLAVLEEIITKRCEAERVFTSPDLVKEIARFSGGNIREMFRLVREACQFAEGERIDQLAFDSALRNIKMDFERRLVTLPYRALERVYKEKGVHNLEDLTLETLNKFYLLTNYLTLIILSK